MRMLVIMSLEVFGDMIRSCESSWHSLCNDTD